MAPKPNTVEEVIAEVAARQWGVVTRQDLLGAGISDDEIKHRARIGLLIRQHRGVYRVGHTAPSREATYLAAVRACGDRAVLFAAAAAHLWGVLKGRPPAPQVIVPTYRRVKGVVTRRAHTIDPRDVTVFRGIPVTTIPRTLVDLAAILSVHDLGRACHEAGVLHRTTPRQVEAVLARRSRWPGGKRLRSVMRGEVPVTLSALEAKFLELLREHGLPLPQSNRPAGGRRVDCRWPDRALTVELDSYAFHNSRHSWEQDRAREREARSGGDEFRRFTHADVCEDQRYMLRELRGLLGPAR